MPTGLMQRTRRAVKAFGYDAVAPTNKRRAPPTVMRSEDAELTADQRRKNITLKRDCQRNFAIAAWMIRRHLDFTTTFSFQAKTGNKDLDTLLEKLVAEKSSRENCDIAGRHRLSSMIRLAEARRIVDDDCGLMRLATGHLQAIEGDRIRSPYGTEASIAPDVKLCHGVQVDKAGKAIAYSVCSRGSGTNSFTFERMVPAENLYLHSSCDRFDQVRGISPLTAALNSLRDTYEGFDLALAKMKVSQLFGLFVYRQAETEFGFGQTVEVDSGDEDGESNSPYEIDLGKGPVFAHLDPGDRAEFLESKSPAIETQQFLETIIQVCLKALDIPFSFFSENFTNYSGQRQAFLQYERAADIKRGDVKQLLNWITRWWVTLFVQEGKLPAEILDTEIGEWVPVGLPWLDPQKEIDAEVTGFGAGLDNPEDAAQRHGRNFYQNIDKTAACLEYAKSKGVDLYSLSGKTPLAPPTGAPVDDSEPPSGDQKKDSQGKPVDE